MAGKKREGAGRGRGYWRGLGDALLVCTVVCCGHRRGSVSVGRVYARARRLGVALVCGEVVHRRRGQLHWLIDGSFDIANGIEARRLMRLARSDDAPFIGWASCAASGARAPVLHWQNDNIIGRRHGPMAWNVKSQWTRQPITHGTRGTRQTRTGYQIG
jgi:hypothetical protein